MLVAIYVSLSVYFKQDKMHNENQQKSWSRSLKN